MNYFLFLLVNAMLFIRPTEFAPDLLGLPIYEGLILGCLVLSLSEVLDQLTFPSLTARPVSACVAGLLPAIVLSQLANFRPGEAGTAAFEFFKVLLYYFLLVGLVTTPARLARFLSALALFCAVITALAVLQYHGAIALEAIHFEETPIFDDALPEPAMLRRLGSTGLFHDPNDMCLMLIISIIVCLFNVLGPRRQGEDVSWTQVGNTLVPTPRRGGLVTVLSGVLSGRLFWGALLLLFGHALVLTHSRGGLLGLLTGLAVLLGARFGRKALPIGLIVMPVVLALFAGRQTDFSLSGGTGRTRIQLWHEGMALFVHRPLFGIGSDQYAEYVGQVAHNSFIHAYTELGFLGGTLFLGAFVLAFVPLWRLGPHADLIADDELRRLRPYVLAIVGGYTGGIMSLSNTYTIPTYTVLGMAAAYQRLASADLGVTLARVEARLVRRIGLLSAAFVVVAYLYVRVVAHLG